MFIQDFKLSVTRNFIRRYTSN